MERTEINLKDLGPDYVLCLVQFNTDVMAAASYTIIDEFIPEKMWIHW
jgi:hypothetical protein